MTVENVGCAFANFCDGHKNNLGYNLGASSASVDLKWIQ